MYLEIETNLNTMIYIKIKLCVYLSNQICHSRNSKQKEDSCLLKIGNLFIKCGIFELLF